MGNLGRVGYGGTLEGTWCVRLGPFRARASWPSLTSFILLQALHLRQLRQRYARQPDQARRHAGDCQNWQHLERAPLVPPGSAAVGLHLPGRQDAPRTQEGRRHLDRPLGARGTLTHSQPYFVTQGGASRLMALRLDLQIDLVEAQVDHDTLLGQVSQSCQFAPFNLRYEWDNKTNMVRALRVLTAPDGALAEPSRGDLGFGRRSLTTLSRVLTRTVAASFR
jgi:hypothetical protein